jgi:hypothetical protein
MQVRELDAMPRIALELQKTSVAMSAPFEIRCAMDRTAEKMAKASMYPIVRSYVPRLVGI